MAGHSHLSPSKTTPTSSTRQRGLAKFLPSHLHLLFYTFSNLNSDTQSLPILFTMPKSLAWYTFMAYDGELPIPLQTRTYLRIYLDDPRFKALVQNQTSKLTCKFIEVALQTTSRDPKSPSWFAALVLVTWGII